VTLVNAQMPPASGPAGAAVIAGAPARHPSPVTGGGLLALAMSLRSRGLRGLDVLRRSQDRAPPASA
jgi:hypothetical protein